MAEPRSKRSVVRYYCTAGNGMEAFLIDEVKTKLAAEDVCHIPGKVLFSSSANINRISNLKAAERLFLLLKQDLPVNLSVHSSAAKAASVLQFRLLDDKNQWTSAVMTWSRLQGELAGSKTTFKASNSALRLTWEREAEVRGSEEQREEGKKSLVESRTSSEGERKNIIGRHRIVEQNGVLTMAQKRKRDEEEEDRKRKAATWDTSIEKIVEERMRVEEAEAGMLNCRKNGSQGTDFSGSGSFCDPTTSRLEPHGESRSRRLDDIAKDFTEESQEKVKPTGERNKMSMTTCKDKPELLSCVPVSFRISCKCSGSLSRCLSTQEVSRVIGAGLSRLLGWKADLKNPQLEINVHLSDDYCLLGIPLTRLPLANRSYIKITGLRSTTAWAMASLAHIQPGFSVVDPMCGVGTILIEAAQEHKDSCFLGVDIDDEQLQKARENIAFGELGNRIHLLKASSLGLFVLLCVCSTASAQCQCRCCDLRPAIWQEVWLQNRYGYQLATHPDRDGETSSSWWCPGSPPESSVVLPAQKTSDTKRHQTSV
ncbi:THUMP domain-containing protein 2 isoform X2 [Archocentrus centrarchus]|uniref:THUMP domain-containing protein 2 isoform X2 n=1 Tax=Archocentrus centrarchus TaxID=63155 RepID=UPI0011E9D371|nr:THUMP domain-containing protein 2 isoform X2 [Archocentrus centrarchus]